MQSMSVLLTTAASIALIHTLLGPDHYLPFIAIAKARQWSVIKTLWITGISGLGHVLGSIVLGFLGIAAGIGVQKLEFTESARGNVAAWMLTAFGLVYGLWGIRRAIQNKPHKHKHLHPNGTAHMHIHMHSKDHHHPHMEEDKNVTPWILFKKLGWDICISHSFLLSLYWVHASP